MCAYVYIQVHPPPPPSVPLVTLDLCVCASDVENSLSELDRIIGFHHMADETEGRIREGPSGSIEAYLKLLEKLESALTFFSNNNPSSVELPRLNALYDDGMDNLTKEFLNLLKRDSKPVPIQVLNDISSESAEGDGSPMCASI